MGGWKCQQVPDAILLHYSLKFRKRPKTRPASLIIAKICTYYAALRAWYLEPQTHLPETKQEITPSQIPTLCSPALKISLYQQELGQPSLHHTAITL